MKIKKIFVSLAFLLIVPAFLMSQTEKVDLNMIYRIKQEGLRNSAIEELAFGLTDLTGPRLTGSAGSTRGYEWAKKKMEELGFQNVRIEEARDFNRGGWDNYKAYAAMTAPYYINFACNPVAWTGSTNGLIKDTLIFLDVKSENDLEKYKGKLAGKIVLMPSATTYEVSYEPLASRFTDEQLKELSMAVQQQGRRSPAGDYAKLPGKPVMKPRTNVFQTSQAISR
jgi:hypothetical protein